MKVSIVGAGVSGLFCAYHLIKNNIEVELFEKESSLAKKFLVAGKSGLNITSSYPTDNFHSMYFENADIFRSLLSDFSASDTINWLKELGFETFEGSSHKVFPKEFKAANLLKEIKDILLGSSLFNLQTSKELIDFDSDYLYFKDLKLKYEFAIFALGGGSWSKTGSNGDWIDIFEKRDIELSKLRSSNCGFKTDLLSKNRLPLKNISISFKDIELKGESLIYNKGIEGGIIYHLSSFIRDEIDKSGSASISIDFKPSVEFKDLLYKLRNKKPKVSWSNNIKKVINIDPALLDLIKSQLTKEEFFDPEIFCQSIKSFQLSLTMIEDMDKAISTAGGVCFKSVNHDFELKGYSNIYLSGEMLDWEAPTGGFLIQGCYSISYRIVQSLKLKKGHKKR